jgi:hypothetical protein
MFPLAFPFSRLRRAQPGELVLDPFCGRGTTNFAARLRGLSSVGVDSNPVATAIAAAKHVNTTPVDIIHLCNSILADTTAPREVPHNTFWQTCYEERTLHDICKIREYLLEADGSEEHIALRALMLGILHGPKRKGPPSYLSNQMPRTYATKPQAAIRFWEKRREVPSEINVLDVVSRRSFLSFAEIPPKIPGKAVLGDSRHIHSQTVGGPFQWVITSPPYYGMDTYWPDQWLRNWFLGGPDVVTYQSKGQLSHGGESHFIKDLACVWRRVANVCSRGARLIVRFGALPSLARNPATLLKKSLGEANCGWKVITIKSAGSASQGNRQSEQFRQDMALSISEIDLYAVLE